MNLNTWGHYTRGRRQAHLSLLLLALFVAALGIWALFLRFRSRPLDSNWRRGTHNCEMSEDPPTKVAW